MKKVNRRTWMRLAACAITSTAMAASLLPQTLLAAEETDRVAEIMDGMTTRQKITQMLMVDFRQWNDGTGLKDFTEMNDEVRQIIEDYDFGAVIYFANNIKETEQSFDLTMEIQKAATKDGGIPLIISTDQEGGSVYRLGSGTALPGNMALGATQSEADAKAAGEIVGSELSVLGINTTLSPVVDVNNNPNNPVIGLRSFGDDPVEVGTLASAVIEGLDEYGVIGCAKHFPGHGDTATDSHYGLPVVDKSREVLEENELMPYKVAIEKGIDMIMTAHILYPQLDSSTLYSNKTGKEESLPSTMSKAIITDLLKGEMGFDGIVCTDAMNMAGISANWDQVQATVTAMEAGIDLICMPCTLSSQADLANLDAIIDGALAAVESGELTEERLNDAVERILRVKEEKGILDFDEADYSLETALATVGSDENREKERIISADAVTLVKNENNALPMDIQKNTNVLFLLPFSNEPVLTAMAWNRGKVAGTVPTGAKMDYALYTSMTDLSDDIKNKIANADYVVTITEVSSAARMGSLAWYSATPDAICTYAKSLGKTTVIISADKPYDVQLYPDADAIMAVYGCKGSSTDPTEAIVGGITGTTAAYGPNIIAGVEVALGTFGARGALPVNINKFDLETASYTDEVVFERGYGLTYQSKADANRKTMYRLYNPNSGEHFYTQNADERNYLANIGWTVEGIGWIAPAESNTPVYRLYNPNAGDHHYTTNAAERDWLRTLGWQYEGIAWYSDDAQTVPLYRAYNPNAKQAGAHHYTTSEGERNVLVSLGWDNEGIAWYGLENPVEEVQ